MPENTYQKLAELIKKSPKLFGNGGLFGSINENHTVFSLFVDYLKKERRRNGHVPKTISSENFINYLISEAIKSETEIAEIDKKFQALKKEGQINDQLANPQKNTLYNFALLLDEIGILEGNTGQVSSRYNQALKESLQGNFGGAIGRATSDMSGGVETGEAAGSTSVAENAKTSEGTFTEAQLQTNTQTVSSGTGIGTGVGAGTEVETGTGIDREKKALTDKIKESTSSVPAPASNVNPPTAEENLQEVAPTEITLPAANISETSYTLSPEQPAFFRDDGQTPTGESRRSQVFTGGFAGRTLSGTSPGQTRQKIRPIVEILSSRAGEKSTTGRMISPGRRTAGQQQQAQIDTQMQFEQTQRAQSAGSGTGFGRTKKRKSAGMRIAKITAGSSAIPISLLLLGGGSAKAAGFDFVTLILKFLF